MKPQSPWRIGFLIFFSLLGLCVFSCSLSSTNPQSPRASEGVIDLRGWDFERDGNVELDGQWEFYWEDFVEPRSERFQNGAEEKNFIKVPAVWNGHKTDDGPAPPYGFATYRIRVLIDEQTQPISLYLTEIFNNYKCFTNGELAAEIGQVGRSRESSVPRKYTQTVVINSDGSEIEIIFWVSNFVHIEGAGLRESPVLGTEQQIRLHREKLIARDISLVSILLIMGIYHFCIFVIRPKDISPLYFALFALFVSLYNATLNVAYLTQIFPDLDWNIVIKLINISVYMSLALLVIFISSLFPLDRSLLITRIFAIICLLCSGITIFTPSFIHSHLILPFQIIILLACFYVTFIIVVAVKRKRGEARPVLAGWVVLFLFVIHDLLHENYIINTGYLLSVGFLLFILSQSFVLALRFRKAFTQSEHLASKLDLKSIELEKANEELIKFNRELDLGVKERTQELEQAHQQLLKTAHQAGMAEISSNIIHSIGNILNTLNCKAQTIGDTVRNSKSKKLDSLKSTFEENQENITEFLTQEFRAENLTKFISLTSEIIKKENTSIALEAHGISELVEKINEVIISQQEYAELGAKKENISIHKTLDGVLRFFENELGNINIETTFHLEENDTATIVGQRTKVTFALTEIIRNSIESLNASNSSPQEISLSIIRKDQKIIIKVTDNGVGIPDEDLAKIFAFGYSTKTNNRGFSLHTLANYIKEMKGEITAHSDGPGQGATFTVAFPASTPSTH